MDTDDELNKERQEALRASAAFVRTAVRAVSDAQAVVDNDPAATFTALQKVVSSAATDLNDHLVRSPKLALEVGDTSTLLGRIAASADRMTDVTRNIAESYGSSIKRDQADDSQKQTFRAFTQSSLFDFAANISTTADFVTQLSRDWKAEADVTHPVSTTAPTAVASVQVNLDAKVSPSRTAVATAIDATGNADPEKPIVEDGWTIMFRSKNPLLWNVAVRNKDSYAVPTTVAPEFRYIRMRRMDTKDQVILKGSEFTGRIYPAKSPFFRGDKPVGRGTCALGIVDTRHVDPNVCGVLDNTPQGCLGGWGFGSAEAGPAKQRFLWDSEEIESTEMEIAVTNRDLTPQEQEHVLKK